MYKYTWGFYPGSPNNLSQKRITYYRLNFTIFFDVVANKWIFNLFIATISIGFSFLASIIYKGYLTIQVYKEMTNLSIILINISSVD